MRLRPVFLGHAVAGPGDACGALDLGPSWSLVALVNTMSMSESDRRNLALVRTVAIEQAESSGIVIGPEYRAVGVFRDDLGVRGMFEFVPAAI